MSACIKTYTQVNVRHKTEGIIQDAPVSEYCANKTPITTTYAGLALSLHPTPSTSVLSMNVRNTKFPLCRVGAVTRTVIITAIVPTAFHHTAILLRFLRALTPKVLMRPVVSRMHQCQSTQRG